MESSGEEPIRVVRWPTERPLLALNAIVALGLWYLLVRSIWSMPFVLGWAGFFALLNIVAITAIRGSAVRLGPNQFPELHGRVASLAQRIGLRRTPDVYLLQQDGALNAFATRFLRTHMVVLLSDLLEACGDNQAARDMIIGHELGHIRAGHLRARWLLMPASFVPFLGSALSRAREYTCDRYGRATAGDRDGALLGLTILAAGGAYGPHVNPVELANQRRDLRGTWMMLGEWLGSHPPLAKRISALAPDFHMARAERGTVVGWLFRVAIALGVVVIVGASAVSAYLPRFGLERRATKRPPANAEQQVRRELESLKALVEQDRRRGREVPWDIWDLYSRWEEAHPDERAPKDPFSGYWYDYTVRGDAYRIWSLGPDGENHTADDIILDSTKGATPRRRIPVKADRPRGELNH